MSLPAKHVYDVLKDKNVDTLYHANSVLTTCQFLNKGSIMSRGSVEQIGGYQTEQDSDRIDKRYGIWYDIFFDSIDIHSRGSRANKYGPVLLCFDIEIITRLYTGNVWVTKLNPTKWAGKSDEKRWFESKRDLEENFVPSEFDQMIVFRHCGGVLPFKSYLNQIILDDPQMESTGGQEIQYYSMAFGALKSSMLESNVNIPIKKRECTNVCDCLEYYQNDRAKTNKYFLPEKIE